MLNESNQKLQKSLNQEDRIFTSLLNMVKELELTINLSPVLAKPKAKKVKQALINLSEQVAG